MAGPNGAGKSTLYRALVRDEIISADMAFVNADLFERDHLQHITDAAQRSEAARHWAEAQRAAKLGSEESFVSETVFSHESKLALIQDAIAQDFVVALYVVALDDPQRLLARVQRRISEGGHPVPPDKILSRYPRTLTNLSKAVSLASVAYLYEARELEEGGPYMVAMCQGPKVTVFVDRLPQWTKTVLGEEEPD
ncbi:AAA family ATPase [Polaromonas sp.]|uniref:AAA family ATPase n=1 Tax=Polaromonas sp. TaxID=1869339 RepID=UPI002D781694|nr:AAA family ATPase [Polaromonas sp.]